ncbi:MAG: hypothetical protein WBD86_03780 [Microgenomates group bacterium]
MDLEITLFLYTAIGLAALLILLAIVSTFPRLLEAAQQLFVWLVKAIAWLFMAPIRLVVFFIQLLILRPIKWVLKRLVRWFTNLRGERRRLIKEIRRIAKKVEPKEEQLEKMLSQAFLVARFEFEQVPMDEYEEASGRLQKLIKYRKRLLRSTIARPVENDPWFKKEEERWAIPPEKGKKGRKIWRLVRYCISKIEQAAGKIIWRFLSLPIKAVANPLRKASPAYRSATLWSLRRLRAAWVSLEEQMDALSEFIESLPELFEQHIQEIARKKQEELEREKEGLLNDVVEAQNRRINQAKVSLAMAGSHLQQLESIDKNQPHPMKGSNTLSFKKILSMWKKKIKELKLLEVKPDEVESFIEESNSLVNNIGKAPGYYQQVVQAEERIKQVRRLYKMLTGRHPKLDIPKGEIKNSKEMLERVPGFWLSADWKFLRMALVEVQQTIDDYIRVIIAFLRANRLEIDDDLAEILGRIQPESAARFAQKQSGALGKTVGDMGTRIDSSLQKTWDQEWSPDDPETEDQKLDALRREFLSTEQKRL